MNQNVLNDHYKKVANRYDESFSAKNFTGYSFSGEAGARTIVEMMNIGKDDRVVDLGSGTCVTAGFIASMAELANPVICVDPVREMLDVGIRNKIANIETICETAEQFSQRRIHYDKLLIKGTVHHFPVNNLRQIFTGISRQLSTGGVILIEKTPGKPAKGYPSFEKALKLHSEFFSGLSDILVNLFKELGFQVSSTIVTGEGKISKAEAINNIRNRYTSTLELLSHEEIEAGIAEVERNFPEIIEYEHQREIMIAVKHLTM